MKVTPLWKEQQAAWDTAGMESAPLIPSPLTDDALLLCCINIEVPVLQESYCPSLPPGPETHLSSDELWGRGTPWLSLDEKKPT